MTKQWNEYRATIISYYKEQHMPLHEVQRLMAEKHGFKASVRAYRSRFDRWGVNKYNCRRRRGSTPNGSSSSSPRADGSSSSPNLETDESTLVSMTPPSTPPGSHIDRPGAPNGPRVALTVQPISVMPHQHDYFSQGNFGVEMPLSPQTSAGSADGPGSPGSASIVSRRSSGFNRAGMDFSNSPTDHFVQFGGGYDQQQQQSSPDSYPQYQQSQQYQPIVRSARGGVLALPTGVGAHHGQNNGGYTWNDSPLQAPYSISSAHIKR